VDLCDCIAYVGVEIFCCICVLRLGRSPQSVAMRRQPVCDIVLIAMSFQGAAKGKGVARLTLL